MTPAQLASSILDVVLAAVAAGELPLPAEAVPAELTLDRPKNKDHGDYATNIALQLAKPAGRPPREIAALLATGLAAIPGIASVDIAGPGFLNVRLAAGAAGELARLIVAEGNNYGHLATLAGHQINLEFISANPTGPLHLGHTRWAAVGDALGRVLEAAGASVTREFYINDRGVQMDLFGESLAASAAGEPIPEKGYHGDYIPSIAAQIVVEHPEFLALSGDDRMVAFREAGYALQLAQQKAVLDGFRTHFDVWSSERELHSSGAVDRGLTKLREQGHVFEADGAVWLRTTDFDDDKDRVLIKADGALTYFSADTAYYLDKRQRGFDLCIYLLGADHHGYVNRLRTVAACAGDDPDTSIEVLIGQLVKILENGEELKLSKRAGTIVTLEEFVEIVGVDAARYSLCRYPVDSPLTLDVAVLTAQRNENHVYSIQYVAARTASVIRNAADVGLVLGTPADFDPALLVEPTEAALLGVLGDFPKAVSSAAELHEPHRIARYLEELAGSYHRFYDACRILPRGDEELNETMRARLWLNAAARQVIENGLSLLGVTAPERM